MNIWKTKSPAQIAEAAEHTQLKKNLTAFDLAALGVGSVVGTGIFVATGQGAQLAGPGVLLSFIIAAVTCGFCALTYSELACMFPVAGSTYSYSYVAFGEVIAWIIGWDLMLEYLVAASAVASGWSTTFIGLIQSAGVKLPKAFLTPPITTVNHKVVLSGGVIDLPAVIITLLITWVLYIGIRESAKINNVIVMVKVAVILLFIVLGVRHVSLANLQPMMPFGWKGVMAGAAIIFFAYIGFDAVSTAAEETKNPKRDVPLGLMICLGVVIVLYVAVAFVLTGIVPYKQIDVGNALPAALAGIGIRWGGALVRHRGHHRHGLDAARHPVRPDPHLHGHGPRRPAAAGLRQGPPQAPHAAPVHLDHGRRHGPHRRAVPAADDHRPLQHRHPVRVRPGLDRRHPAAEDAARGREEVQDAGRTVHAARDGRLLLLPHGTACRR
ncbi:MAG: amino acid permease [Desulfobacterales bacterium]|nr:amino acid permease [Desulfobacterales bacterium]